MKRKGSKQKKDDPDKRGPKFLIWLVTTKCNLKCSHCYAAKFADGELSLEEKFSVVRDAVQTGIKEINLTGGEILLHKDGLKLINYIAEQGMDLNVFTNGTTLSEKVVKEYIKKLQEKTIAKVSQNIDLLKIHGPLLGMPYSKMLIKGIYELRIRGKEEIRILYTLSKSNIYLLHAFKKQTQKTPKKEIIIAENRKKLLDKV